MSTPRLKEFSIKGYRSIDGWLHVVLPDNEPLVLIGENNAGKSNVLSALGFMFGDFWPGSHRPEDHEYFGRVPEGNEIKLIARTSGIQCDKGCRDSDVEGITWSYAPDESPPSRFGRSTSRCGHTFMSNSIRQSLFCMSVGVNRDLSYQLSYGSKWTTLSKLMRRFHDRLVADPERLERLREIFESLKQTFHEVDEFQVFGDSLRTAFTDFGGNLRYGLGVDFSAYDPSNYFRSLRVFPHVDGSPRTYEELGTGQEQVLAMSFAYAYAKAFGGEGLLLAIEEPESHLHPLAQQWLARKLRELAAIGVQVIVTTHSPYFVDLAKPWTVVVLRKTGEDLGTTATQHTAEGLAAEMIKRGAPPSVTTAESVGVFYDATSTYATLSGLFARVCVLVEGATEELALPELIKRAGLDVLQQGIAIVPVEGISNMAKWARLYSAYGIPVYALFDTDTDRAEAQTSLASANETLAALGVEGDRQVVSGGLHVADLYACFDSNFEVAMRGLFRTYSHLETIAASTVGRSKPLKARMTTRSLPAPAEEPEAWAPIKALAAAIERLAPQPRSPDQVKPISPRPTSGVSRQASRP
jgi:putative ATP-dependent endonuclease of the OLD family